MQGLDKFKEQLKAFISEVEKSPVDGKNMFRGQGISAMPMSDFTNLLRNIFELHE